MAQKQSKTKKAEEATANQKPPQEEPLTGKGRNDEWDGEVLMVGFPTHKLINPVTSLVLSAICLDLSKDRVRIEPRFGDAMIHNARNKVAQAFLETTCKWLLFVDDDMVPAIGRPEWLKDKCSLPPRYRADAAGLHFAHRLTGHKEKATLVGATYFDRRMGGMPINGLRRDPEYQEKVVKFADEILETPWIGTGCLLIHRSVFLDIKEKFPELAPSEMDGPWRFFQPGADGAGEDIAFCRRAKEAGHMAYVDCALHALHIGYMAYGVHTSAFSTLNQAWKDWGK